MKKIASPVSGRRSSLFVRTSLSLAVGVLISSTALAQSSEGSIYGEAKAGASVTVTDLNNGSSRTIKADGAGAFTLPKLSPGRYRVESGGVKQEVSVAIGSGSRVSLTNALAEVSVTGARVRPPIDFNSVESNTVFTSEQLQVLPVARSVNAVALLAPGAVQGDDGLGAGKIPSFGGASVAENGYYINGFDVTNITFEVVSNLLRIPQIHKYK